MTSDPDSAVADSAGEAERHASWAELFFDLIAVAGVGLLAHVLVGDLTAHALGLYAVLFLAFWLSWTTYMLYGNVAAGETRILRLLGGMFGLGVMAASVPGIGHLLLDDGHDQTPAVVFAIAYFVTRILGAKSWGKGEVLLDFPMVQHTAGALPWLVSVWVDDPAWKLGLWAAGVAIDLVGMVVVSGDDALESVTQRVDELKQRLVDRPDTGGRRGSQLADFEVAGIRLAPEHLAERLGLFVIIVLGEGVIQVVTTAGERHWDDASVLGAGLGAFLLLASMFAMSLLYGHAGVPHLRAGGLSLRATLGLHGLVTATMAAVAVAVGSVVAEAPDSLDDSQRWLLCGGVAVYFAIGVAASLPTGTMPWRRTVLWLLSGVAVPLALGAFADRGSGVVLVWYVVLVLAVQVFLARRVRQAPAP